MDRTVLAVGGLALLLVLAGCSTGTNANAKFESAITEFENETAAHETYEVDVHVKNVGEERGSYPVQFLIGNDARSRTVTLDPGENKTLTFTHTFEEPGTYSVTVNETEQDVTVVEYDDTFEDPIIDDAHTTMSDLSTVTEYQERKITVKPGVVSPMETADSDEMLTIEEQSTAVYNFETRRLYSHVIHDLEESDSADSGTEEWFVDTHLYTRENATDSDGTGATEYDVESAQFSDAQRTDPARILRGVDEDSRTETEESYIYTVDPEDDAALQNFIHATVDESDLVTNYLKYLETLDAEIHIDKETHHITMVSASAELVDDETSDVMGTLDIQLEYSHYNEDVTITVPDDVRNNVTLENEGA